MTDCNLLESFLTLIMNIKQKVLTKKEQEYLIAGYIKNTYPSAVPICIEKTCDKFYNTTIQTKLNKNELKSFISTTHDEYWRAPNTIKFIPKQSQDEYNLKIRPVFALFDVKRNLFTAQAVIKPQYPSIMRNISYSMKIYFVEINAFFVTSRIIESSSDDDEAQIFKHSLCNTQKRNNNNKYYDNRIIDGILDVLYEQNKITICIDVEILSIERNNTEFDYYSESIINISMSKRNQFNMQFEKNKMQCKSLDNYNYAIIKNKGFWCLRLLRLPKNVKSITLTIRGCISNDEHNIDIGYEEPILLRKNHNNIIIHNGWLQIIDEPKLTICIEILNIVHKQNLHEIHKKEWIKYNIH